MQSKTRNLLIYITLIIVSAYFLFNGLVEAQGFLAPLAVGTLLAMIILPVAQWFERKGINRVLSSLVSTIIVLMFFLAMAAVVVVQINSFAEDWPEMKDRMQPKVENVQQFIAENLGISVAQQQQKIEQWVPGSFGQGPKGADTAGQTQQQDTFTTEKPPPKSGQGPATAGPDEGGQETGTTGNTQQQAKGGGGGMSQSLFTTAGSFLAGLVGFLGRFVLIFTYIFFFLLFRNKFRKSIVKFAPEEQRAKANKIIHESAKTSQQYLFGRLILIVILAVFYSIGLMISGVNNAVLIGIIAAFLTFVPFIGNILGYFLAVAMSLFSKDPLMAILGVSITFGVSQILENNVLQPFIVGKKVDLDPFITIVVVILGGAVWGVVGMFISIPVLGIVKVVCDHVPLLSPVAYLLGGNDGDSSGPNFFDKVKNWFKDKL